MLAALDRPESAMEALLRPTATLWLKPSAPTMKWGKADRGGVSGDDIGNQQVAETPDFILQHQLAFFKALDFQLIAQGRRSGARSYRRDRDAH